MFKLIVDIKASTPKMKTDRITVRGFKIKLEAFFKRHCRSRYTDLDDVDGLLKNFEMLIKEQTAYRQIAKDFEKVNLVLQTSEFGTANTHESITNKDLKVRPYMQNPYIGCHVIGDVTFLGGVGGSTYSEPTFFILYFDKGHKLRAYVPRSGNAYNYLYSAQFGDCDGSQNDTYAKTFGESSIIEIRRNNPSMFDIDLLIKDIKQNITL